MQADLRGKVTREIEVKSSVDFHELFACKTSELAKTSPSIVQSCKVLEGEFGKTVPLSFGTLLKGIYDFMLILYVDGKACIGKDMIENCDFEKKTVTFHVMEGEFMMGYKTFLIHLHVKKGAGDTSLVEWTLEYEKLNEDVPHPTGFLDILELLTKQAA